MKWELNSPDMSIVKDLMFECDITERQAKLLVNRKIDTIDKANKYLYGDIRDLYHPSTLKDIDKAVDVLIDARKNKKSIFIVGDYDVDGETSVAQTYLALTHIGLKVDYHIPHRTKEGYGLSMTAIDAAIEKKCDLIYTVDNGISAFNEISKAKELGLSVIITDHHDIPKDEQGNVLPLPPADAIINPKQDDCKYPNKGLCGCSVSWKVMLYLYEKLGIDNSYLYSLLPLVALATVGDMMPLQDENRIIVKEGMKRINKDMNLGISKLKEVYKIKEVTSESLSFQIVPALNADGRLFDAYKSVELLLSKDTRELQYILRVLKDSETIKNLDEKIELQIRKIAKKVFDNIKEDEPLSVIQTKAQELFTLRTERLNKIANELYETNEERKELTKKYMKECIATIKNEKLDEYEVMIVLHDSIPEGIVGLVAGRLKEKYHKPTFVFSKTEQWFKGSGRGVDGHPLSLSDALRYTKDLWAKGGGHPMACGISFEKNYEKFNEFRERLNNYTKLLLKENPFTPVLYIDEIINDPTEELCREIEILQPTGLANKNVVFGTNTLNVVEVKPIGDGTHIRFKLANKCVAVGFGLTQLFTDLNLSNRIKFAYNPNINLYTFVNQQQQEVTLKTIQMMLSDMNGEEETITSGNKSMLISSIKQNVSRRIG